MTDLEEALEAARRIDKSGLAYNGDVFRLARALLNALDWRPIESAPKDGTLVDLWIVGSTDDVDFYAADACEIKGKPLRHGRATGMRWQHRPPNPANWYPMDGLGYPLSPNVMATHYRPLPAPPREKSGGST